MLNKHASTGQEQEKRNLPQEIKTLLEGFKRYKSSGDLLNEIPKYSTEVLINNTTTFSDQIYGFPNQKSGAPWNLLENKGISQKNAQAKYLNFSEDLKHFLQVLEKSRSLRNQQKPDDISNTFEKVQLTMKASSSDFNLENFLTESNVTKNNENQLDSQMSSVIAKLQSQQENDFVKIGYLTPENHLEQLKSYQKISSSAPESLTSETKESSLEKYFHVTNQSQQESLAFKNIVSKQIFTLFSIYLQKQKLNEEDNKSFFDYVASFLQLSKDESQDSKSNDQDKTNKKVELKVPSENMRPISITEARQQVSVDLGLKFALSIMQQLAFLSSKSQESSKEFNDIIKQLLDTIKVYRPGALYCYNDRMSFQLDENLNQLRQFLVTLFEQADLTKEEYLLLLQRKCLCLKTILILGIVRSSIEDYLTVLQLLSQLEAIEDPKMQDSIKETIDLTDELNDLFSFYGYMPERDQTIKVESNSEGKIMKAYKLGQQNSLTSNAIRFQPNSGDLWNIRGQNGDRIITDDQHFYVYKAQEERGSLPGLYKLTLQGQMAQSSQSAAYRMPGRTLVQNTSDFFQERALPENREYLDGQMIMINDFIFLKHEIKPKISTDNQNQKKTESTQENQQAKLIIVDSKTLKVLGQYKKIEKEIKEEEKSKEDKSKPENVQHNQIYFEPYTISLEGIRSWKGEYKVESKDQIQEDSKTKTHEDDFSFEGSSLFTDGNFLYVAGGKKIPKTASQPAKYATIVNIYRFAKSEDNEAPSKHQFVFQRQITLFWKENEQFILGDNNLGKGLAQKAWWASNGQVLLCFQKKDNQLHCFDMFDGELIQSIKPKGELNDSSVMYFCPYQNLFYKLLTKDSSYDYPKYWIFCFSNFKVKNNAETPKDLLNQLRKEIFTNEKSNALQNYEKNQNIIKNLMKIVKTAKLQVDHKNKVSITVQRTLLLDFLANYSREKFLVIYEEMKSKEGSSQSQLDDILNIFKFHNSTYLTENNLILLADNLLSTLHTIKRNTDVFSQESVATLYGLLSLLQILAANFKGLSFCSIKLSQLLDDEMQSVDDEQKVKAQNYLRTLSQPQSKTELSSLPFKGYNYFMAVYEATVVQIVENGVHKVSVIEQQDAQLQKSMIEIEYLWKRIEEDCHKIIDESTNLLHSDPLSMVDVLIEGLNKPLDQISLQNVSVQLGNLNLKDNLRKVIDHPKLQQLAQLIFDHFSSLINLAYQQPNSSQKVFEIAARDFILGYCQLLLQRYFEVQEQIGKKDRKKGSSNVQTSTQYEDLFRESLLNVFKFLISHLEQFRNQIQRQEKDEIDKKLVYLNNMSHIFKVRNIFYECSFVYMQTIALFKLDFMNEGIKPQPKQSALQKSPNFMVQVIKQLTDICTECSQFEQVVKNYLCLEQSEEIDLDVRRVAPDFMITIDSIFRQSSWLLGQTSQRMIRSLYFNNKQQENEPKEGDENAQDNQNQKQSSKQKQLLINLQDSLLLSGGIEPRHLRDVLSLERQLLLQDYIDIIDDSVLSQQLSQQKEPKTAKSDDEIDSNQRDDYILQAIVQEGQHESTDKVVLFLQKALEAKIRALANIQGKIGFKLVRASFALLIKFGDHLEDFVSLIDQLSAAQNLQDQSLKPEDTLSFLKTLPAYNQIFQVWEKANEMRKWVNDQRSRLSLKYEASIFKEMLAQKIEELASQTQKTEELQIDSSQQNQQPVDGTVKDNKDKENKSIKTIDDLKLTPEQKEEFNSKVSDAAFEKTMEALEQISDKVSSKASFLLMMQIPLQFLINKKRTRRTSSMSNKEPKSDEGSAPSEKPADLAIKKPKSCTSCVMNILQTSIERDKIQEQVEFIYSNACKRVAGFKILSQIITLQGVCEPTRRDLINWFTSSLRDGTNKISHYLDGMRGEGTYLENKSRFYFFQIIKEILKSVGEAKSVEQLKFYLTNSMQWKFLGRDHEYLAKLGIFPLLHQGNPKFSDNIISKIWGRPLQPAQFDKQSISSDVLDYFEYLLLSVISRIIDPAADLEEQINKGSKVKPLSLQKAKSIINEDVSETLLLQGSKIIMSELKRYTQAVNQVLKGGDWASYIKNKESSPKVQEDCALNERIEKWEGIKDVKPTEGDKKVKKLDMDWAYNEKFLIRLLSIIHMLSSIMTHYQQNQEQNEKLATLLTLFSDEKQLTVLFEVLTVGSPKVKRVVLSILQLLIKSVPHIVDPQDFDKAIQLLVDRQQIQDGKLTAQEAKAGQLLNAGNLQSLTENKSPIFFQYLYGMAFQIRSKMLSKQTIECQSSYALSQEILVTLRLMKQVTSSSTESDSWNQYASQLVHSVFNEFAKVRENYPLDIDLIISLIRGSEFLCVMPQAYALNLEKQKSDSQEGQASTQDQAKQKEDSQNQITNAAIKKKKAYKILGFVNKNWLKREAPRLNSYEEAEEDTQAIVYSTMKNPDQKVLVARYDNKDLQEVKLETLSAHQLVLLPDLNEYFTKNNKKSKDGENKVDQCELTSELLQTILYQANIFNKSESKDNQQQTNGNDKISIFQLHQNTTILKLLYYNLETFPETFIQMLKATNCYKELLQFVCQQSSKVGSQNEDTQKQSIIQLSWLEQRCAQIRAFACENQSSLLKQKEVKVQLVKDKLYIQTQSERSIQSADAETREEFEMTAIQLLSAINLAAFDKKKDNRLINESDFNVQKSQENEGEKEAIQEIEQTDDIVMVSPENFSQLDSAGFEILNSCKAVITHSVEFKEFVKHCLQKQKQSPTKYNHLLNKPVFLVSQSYYNIVINILNDKTKKADQQASIQQSENQGPSEDTKEKVQRKSEQDRMYERLLGATAFEVQLVEELIQNGCFSRVVAEKIICKEQSLENKTLNFSKIVKQLKDGIISESQLDEARQSEIEKLQEQASMNKVRRRLKKSQIPMKYFMAPEEKSEVLQSLKKNFTNFIYRSESEVSVDEFNGRDAYYQKVYGKISDDHLHTEYEAVLQRLFQTYCRQIFWSLIQADDIETIFTRIL